MIRPSTAEIRLIIDIPQTAIHDAVERRLTDIRAAIANEISKLRCQTEEQARVRDACAAIARGEPHDMQRCGAIHRLPNMRGFWVCVLPPGHESDHLSGDGKEWLNPHSLTEVGER